MAIEGSGQVRTSLPLGVRLLSYILICVGIVASILVIVLGLATGLAGAPFVLGLGAMSFGTTAAGVSLSRGSAWSIAWLKAILVLAVAAAVVAFAIMPILAVAAGVHIAIAGIVLFAPIHYLQLPGVRSTLRPPPTMPIDRVPPSIRRLALRLRTIGGVGLCLLGALALVAVGLAYSQPVADTWDARMGMLVLPFVVLLYAVPCIALGLSLWRASPGPVVVLLGLMLSLMTAVQLGPDAGLVELLAVATCLALAFALLAPPARFAYSALGSK